MSAASQLHPCTKGKHVCMLEYPTPLRGMASLATNRYTAKCHTAQTISYRALNTCLGGAYFKYQQSSLRKGNYDLCM